MTALPFTDPVVVLGDVELRPIAADAALALATRVVSIDPWARLGVAPQAMCDRMVRPWPGGHRRMIVRGDEILGYVSVRWPFMRGPYLETIALFPEARRRGIARRIVDWMAREIDGVEGNLWLCVSEWNTPARAAYAALGFVEIGPIPGLVAPESSEIFMRRPLDPPRP